MSLPPFLLTEVRLTFRLCSQQHVAARRHPFSTTSSVLKKRTKLVSASSSKTPTPSTSSVSPPERPVDEDASSRTQTGMKELVPKDEDGRALDGHRRSDVPMK